MNRREITVQGHRVEIAETGSGPPLLYLHGFCDVHGAVADWLVFHEALARRFEIVQARQRQLRRQEGRGLIDDLLLGFVGKQVHGSRS